MRAVGRHFTYANVMATLAMFAVLGGGAYAAKKIGSSDIKKNAVRSKHIKKNQVKSSDIKNGQVKSSDIADGSVRSAALADGGIAGVDVAANALGGGQVNEGSLGKVPSAVAADTASTVTGTKIRAFDYEIGAGGAGGANVTTLVDEDNIVLKAQCPGGGGGSSFSLWIETKLNNAIVRRHIRDDAMVNPRQDIDFDVGEDFFLNEPGGDNVVGTAEYRNGGQNVVSVMFQGSRNIALNQCHASGHVFLS